MGNPKHKRSAERELRAVLDDLRAGAWGQPALEAVTRSRIERAREALRAPSVRLARWEDGHPDRYTSTDKVGGFWRSISWDEHGDFVRRTGGTRDEARAALAAALDKAEAATSEGGEDRG